MSHPTISNQLHRIQDELISDGVERLDPDTMEALEHVIDEVESRGDCE